jgi:hypothetical protein
MKIQSANQLTGAATGVIVCAFFGALWMVCALNVRQTLSLRTAAWIAPVLILLVLGAIPLLRQAKHWPRVPADPAIRRVFLWANAFEWTGLFAAFFLLSRLHLDNYIFSASTAVIGLHFIPLARIFRSVTHYVTGVALVAWAAISAAFLPIEHLPSDTGFGTGLILWACAVVILARITNAARHGSDFQAA